MIITCLQIRKGDTHYINWIVRDTYYTRCGKSFNNRKGKMTAFSTYAVDDIIPGVCSSCQLGMQDQIDYIKNNSIRQIHGSLLENSIDKHRGIQKKWDSTQAKYGDVISYRKWGKLRRLKRRGK